MIKVNKNLKVSILTPTYNSEKNILDNILSVQSQKYDNLEHIIIDNVSEDKTLDIINKNGNKNLNILHEKDKGIYDALNKGIKKASGDIISILHSDDFYYSDDALTNIVKFFCEEDVQGIYGNLIYVDNKNNTPIRYWKSNSYVEGLFNKGWAPPHPSLFLRRSLYEKYGYFNIDLGNSADFELMRRFIQEKQIKTKYINQVFVVMRYGGQSNKSITSIVKQNYTIIKILGLQKNFLSLLKYIYFKITNRLKQYLLRNKMK